MGNSQDFRFLTFNGYISQNSRAATLVNMPTFFYCYSLGYNRPLKFKELKMEKYNKLRIEWDCRRGMLELDKIIMPFYLKHFDELTDDKKDIFIRLLASTDLQLFSWFFNRGQSSDSDIQSMVEYIQNVQKITTN